MLKKILKYDLKSVYKRLVVFYLLAIFFAIIGRLFSFIDNSFVFNFVSKFSNGIAVGMVINIVINNLLHIWRRFINNFYGDESYLTHTLPISKKTLLLSKFLSSIITIFTSMLVIVITVVIAYYSKDNFQVLKDTLEMASQVYNSTMINLLFIIIMTLFLQLLLTVVIGYTGIIIGYEGDNNKFVNSLLFSFLFYAINQIILLVTIFLIGFINNDIMTLFTTNNVSNVFVLKTMLYIAILINAILITVYYLVCRIRFAKGVNVV